MSCVRNKELEITSLVSKLTRFINCSVPVMPIEWQNYSEALQNLGVVPQSLENIEWWEGSATYFMGKSMLSQRFE